jgi:hypothetical protein
MKWLCTNAIPVLSIVGMVCDIIGAFFVATEVVAQFRGQQYKRGPAYPTATGPVSPPQPRETEEFARWSLSKFRNMRIGLFLLVLGFALQIAANAIQIIRNAA